MTIQNLHDWTLSSVNVRWKEKEIDLHVKGPDKAQVIKISEFSSITIPSLEPWGPSVSINKVWIEENSGVLQISIEMQSGDIILIKANQLLFI